MTDSAPLPDLKQALGAMIFASDQGMTIKDMRACLRDVAKKAPDGPASAFAKIKDTDIAAALAELGETLRNLNTGFLLHEVAGGYRFQSDPVCSPWLRHLLNLGQPKRLSWPALETLSIVAYRQPLTRAEIEAVRGVSVDHILRVLMEMQLVKIVGRSNLPGRPFTYGTTHVFLEHFGLKGLEDLAALNPDLAKPPEPPRPKTRQADWIEDSQSEPAAKTETPEEAQDDKTKPAPSDPSASSARPEPEPDNNPEPQEQKEHENTEEQQDPANEDDLEDEDDLDDDDDELDDEDFEDEDEDEDDDD